MADNRTEFVTIRLSPDERQRIERAARENERTLAGQIRFALRLAPETQAAPSTAARG